MLPAILLLLTEQPGYGYGLVPRLKEFRFGRVDRPAVYRALAQLERDGLVEAAVPTPQPNQPGQARRVYSVTPLGERVLRVWMGVVREEHVHLGEVIRRYQATGTIDAVLSEVEAGWVSDLDVGWSSVSTTSMWRRRLLLPEVDDDEVDAGDLLEEDLGEEFGQDAGGSASAQPRRAPSPEPSLELFAFDPERSAVLIDARSTVGPISFATTGVVGALQAAMVDGALCADVAPTGQLTIDVSALTSGNRLYDAELQRRIDARRFPTAVVRLQRCTPSGPGTRYRLAGELTFHGITREAEGTVYLDKLSEDRIAISGEQDFDIRDFDVPSPTMLMLRIFPDVRVRLHAEAERVRG
jgi:DNA-binding PadR family transcriptional regulator/polyisoprenoid-binding protein YceI